MIRKFGGAQDGNLPPNRGGAFVAGIHDAARWGLEIPQQRRFRAFVVGRIAVTGGVHGDEYAPFAGPGLLRVTGFAGIAMSAPVFVPLTPGWVESATRLSAQAGWNQVPADWERFLRVPGAGAFVYLADGEVRASYSIIRYDGSLAWIGMILVDTAYRGRGLGGAAFDEALLACGEVTAGLDATDLGEPIYRRRGFESCLPISRWMVEGAGSGGTLDQGRLDGEIFGLDAQACGFDRSDLLRDLVLGGGKVIRCIEDGSVAGYGILRPGRTASHLGPVIARTESALSWILDQAASQGGTILCDLLASESAAALEARGFRKVRSLMRMTRPHSVRVLHGPFVCCAAGFELG